MPFRLLLASVFSGAFALAAPAIAADPCPLLRTQVDAPDVATRIAAVACEEHQLWFRPFIDADGRMAGSRVREAENARLANGQPAWERVLEYWRGSGLLRQTPAAGMCEVIVPGSSPASCRTFVVDTPWSAAFVSWVMRRAQVPGYDGSGSHVHYVRKAYRDPDGNAYRIAHPQTTPPARGDLLCYVRVTSRHYGFDGIMAQLAGSDGGLNMHCDVVVAASPDGDGLAYLVGGNVFDGTTMRLLELDASGRLQALPMRSPDDPECTPDRPAACNANRQDWAVLLQLRPSTELATLAPALPAWPTSAIPPPPEPQGCCIRCVLGAGIPRCPANPPRALPPDGSDQ